MNMNGKERSKSSPIVPAGLEITDPVGAAEVANAPGGATKAVTGQTPGRHHKPLESVTKAKRRRLEAQLDRNDELISLLEGSAGDCADQHSFIHCTFSCLPF